jgi:hypothetical protein
VIEGEEGAALGMCAPGGPASGVVQERGDASMLKKTHTFYFPSAARSTFDCSVALSYMAVSSA